MVCSVCGSDLNPGSRFCRRCGAQLALPAMPPPPAQYPPYVAALAAEQRMRVRQNLQPLGITWIIFGMLRIVMGLVGAVIVHNLAYGGIFSDAPPFLPHLMGSLVPVIATVSVVMGLGAVAAGYGLLARQPWGRIVAIVFGILSLMKLPFGTALGIYTLWVLAPRASGDEWDALTRGA